MCTDPSGINYYQLTLSSQPCYKYYTHEAAEGLFSTFSKTDVVIQPASPSKIFEYQFDNSSHFPRRSTKHDPFSIHQRPPLQRRNLQESGLYNFKDHLALEKPSQACKRSCSRWSNAYSNSPLELLCFSDAYQHAMAAVIYITVCSPSTNLKVTSLTCSKGRQHVSRIHNSETRT